MRLWAWQAVAHGADGVLHFRWRTCRFGAEMYWNGILDHDNIPRRRYEEFSLEGAEFQKIGPQLLGTVPLIETAILVEQDQDEAHHTMPMGQSAPWEQREHIYRELCKRHLACGFVSAADSFEGLKVIFMPGFVVMDEELAAKLRGFLARGGVLVASARTATRTRDNQVFSTAAPALLADSFGTTVEECGAHEPLTFTLGGESIPANSYYEILQPLKNNGTRILARWNPLPDRAPHSSPGKGAFTVQRSGNGTAFYLGTHFSAANTPAVVEAVLRKSNVQPLATAPDCIEITCRRDAGRNILFFLNHSGKKQSATGSSAGHNLLTGQNTGSKVNLPAYGVAVIATNKKR
jgi:beta-galactosidase